MGIELRKKVIRPHKLKLTPKPNPSPIEYIDSNYKKEVFDEFIDQ